MNTFSFFVPMSVCLVPVSTRSDTYDGFIKIKGEEYRLCIRRKADQDLTDAEIFYSEELGELLKGHKDTLSQRLSKSSQLDDFMAELVHFLEGVLEVMFSVNLPNFVRTR